MLLGKHKCLTFEIERAKHKSTKLVKLLGLTFDHNLTEDTDVIRIY